LKEGDNKRAAAYGSYGLTAAAIIDDPEYEREENAYED
jgi:hypothetical protein